MSHDSSINTMDHPDFIVCSFMKNSIGLKMVSAAYGLGNGNHYEIVVMTTQFSW